MGQLGGEDRGGSHGDHKTAGAVQGITLECVLSSIHVYSIISMESESIYFYTVQSIKTLMLGKVQK